MSLDFLYTPVSWVLLRWHTLFDAIGVGTNWAWALSIVFLVITARLLLFRLFVKQVHYQRSMQQLQPKIQTLREKYQGDNPELNRQMMALQQSEGFNPLAGCLPMFLQIPVFIGLYHVLRHLSNSNALCRRHSGSGLLRRYTFSAHETCAASQARIFRAPLAASFRDHAHTIVVLGGDVGATRIVLAVVLVISASATFATQLLTRSRAGTSSQGTAATVQKLLLYVIPLGTLVSGLLFSFPLGVLLYWCTSNLWTLAQQAYVVRHHPPADEPTHAGPVGPTPIDGGGGAAPDRTQHVPRVGRRPVRPTGAAPRRKARKR